jgi:hypothetical protein
MVRSYRLCEPDLSQTGRLKLGGGDQKIAQRFGIPGEARAVLLDASFAAPGGLPAPQEAARHPASRAARVPHLDPFTAAF